MMGNPRPNLFLIGAMKSGTSYLSGLLAAHPAVFMSSPKEPCHFADQKVLRKVWPAAWQQGYWRSVDRYLSLFAAAGDAPVIGEASTVYSQAPLFAGVPERILEFSPDARFIYVIRDPVARTISHYWHRVRWWGEHRPVLSAIRSDPRYTAVSYYARQLEVYLRYVERERVYVLTLEALLADTVNQLSQLYGWLGVDSSFQPSVKDIPSNGLPDIVEQRRGLGMLDRFRRTAVCGKMIPYVPRRVRRLGTRLAVRPVRPNEVDTTDVKAFLRPLQQPQATELSRLLNRFFPEWMTLYEQEGQEPVSRSAHLTDASADL
jgi:hypothetical protein